MNDGLIDLRNAINKKYLKKKCKKIGNILEKIIYFDKQQKGRGINILIPK